LRFTSEQRFDFFHVGMSDACLFEFLEIVQDSLAEGSLVAGKLGIFVFQIDSLRFVELVIKEITVREIGLERSHCLPLIRRHSLMLSRPANFQPPLVNSNSKRMGAFSRSSGVSLNGQ
jgi:hypothetical protein